MFILSLHPPVFLHTHTAHKAFFLSQLLLHSSLSVDKQQQNFLASTEKFRGAAGLWYKSTHVPCLQDQSFLYLSSRSSLRDGLRNASLHVFRFKPVRKD